MCDVVSYRISSQFNKKFREMIDAELSTLNTKCTEEDKKFKPKSLPKIISAYLIQFHGLER